MTSYTVKAKFNGSNTYIQSESSNTIITTGNDTIRLSLEFINSGIIVGDNYSYYVKATVIDIQDPTNIPSNIPVTIKIFSDVIPEAQGTTLNINLTGSYTTTDTYTFSSTDNELKAKLTVGTVTDYVVESNTVTASVTKTSGGISTNLIANVSSTDITSGSNLTISGTLTTTDNTPIQNKSIKIYENNVLITTVTTNSSGAYTYNRTVSNTGIVNVNKEYLATFEGSGVYNSSQDSKTVIVRPLINYSINNLNNEPTFYQSWSARFQVLNNNIPIGANQTVKITANGVEYDKLTDSYGVASLPIGLNPGTYTITAEYQGATCSKVINVTAKILSSVTRTPLEVNELENSGNKHWNDLTASKLATEDPESENSIKCGTEGTSTSTTGYIGTRNGTWKDPVDLIALFPLFNIPANATIKGIRSRTVAMDSVQQGASINMHLTYDFNGSLVGPEGSVNLDKGSGGWRALVYTNYEYSVPVSYFNEQNKFHINLHFEANTGAYVALIWVTYLAVTVLYEYAPAQPDVNTNVNFVEVE